MDFSASSIYGGMPSLQATPTPTPDHAGQPEPMARNTAMRPMIGNPTMLLVGLLAAAIGLVHVSVRVGG
jgi:hypothetical protein